MGSKIKIYTDYKNLITDALGTASDRVYRWRLLLEEFAPEIVYIKGIHNNVADAISRLDYTPTTKREDSNKTGISQPAMCHCAFMQSLADENDIGELHVRWETFLNALTLCQLIFQLVWRVCIAKGPYVRIRNREKR